MNQPLWCNIAHQTVVLTVHVMGKNRAGLDVIRPYQCERMSRCRQQTHPDCRLGKEIQGTFPTVEPITFPELKLK